MDKYEHKWFLGTVRYRYGNSQNNLYIKIGEYMDGDIERVRPQDFFFFFF